MASAIQKGGLLIFLVLVIVFSARGFVHAEKASVEISNSDSPASNVILQENDSYFEKTLNACAPVSGPQKNYVKTGNPLVTSQAILLMETKKTDFEKLKSAFDFAAGNVSYKVYENWRYPEEVLETRDGDCTDKSVLLVSMLKNEGIDAYVVYGKEVKDYSHAWVAAKISGNWVQIDPTAGDINYFYECSSDVNCKYYENYKIAGMFNEKEVLKCES